MASEELRRIADQLLQELTARFPLRYRPILIWKNLRVSAGLAYTQHGRIALSSIVLKDEAAVRDTLIHEYAHLLAVDRHGKAAAGHGPHWQMAMIELGARPVVRHRYEVERNVPRQKVTYRCAKCGELIERKKRLPRRRRYSHVGCGGEVKLHRVDAI